MAMPAMGTLLPGPRAPRGFLSLLNTDDGRMSNSFVRFMLLCSPLSSGWALRDAVLVELLFKLE